MIGTKVSPDAPAGPDMGYFTGGLSNYVKYIMFPEEWKNDCVGLKFDGAMMNAVVDVNGCKVGSQHYGYAPFYVELTGYVTFGRENRITVNVNTSMQPNSRWYTGSGLYRGVKLCHGPRVHIASDGVFVFTREVADGYAFLEARTEVENASTENRLAEVTVSFSEEGKEEILAKVRRVIYISSGKTATAVMAVNLKNPKLWDIDHPQLYNVKVRVKSIGTYRTYLIKEETEAFDESEVLFGIRTITADAVRGLRINGREVKLRGGCVHHDNGLLGAVSLYEAEVRKVRKLKEAGFNAIRAAHNPPSAALIEACDRLGMYVLDEAFDAWGMAKRGGDYSQYFETCWEEDLTAFVKRDRTHPSVILWSTGNEIPERGGHGNGYEIAFALAETIHRLDGTRPVTNALCPLWSGPDDEMTQQGQSKTENAGEGLFDIRWEERTEPFTNGLDIVGYNYMEDVYEHNHIMYPERVMLGTETFPQECGFRWPLVKKYSYIIGDFTWTAWDYIGEAGIGKAVYVDADDPAVEKGYWGLMPQESSHYPWRTANDADFDITGVMRPQGAYRRVVWGYGDTYLYSMHPDTFGKVQVMSMWGFPETRDSWNYFGYEGKPVELVVYSCAEEVEVFVNGRSIGRKAVCMDRPMPCSVHFETAYEPGKVEAVSYTGGREISRDELETSEEAAKIVLIPEKTSIRADGHDLVWIDVQIHDRKGRIVPDAEMLLRAEVTGAAWLAGFGSANPVTCEDYTDENAVTFRGRAQLIIRSGSETGEICVKVFPEKLEAAALNLTAV